MLFAYALRRKADTYRAYATQPCITEAGMTAAMPGAELIFKIPYMMRGSRTGGAMTVLPFVQSYEGNRSTTPHALDCLGSWYDPDYLGGFEVAEGEQASDREARRA